MTLNLTELLQQKKPAPSQFSADSAIENQGLFLLEQFG